MTTGGRRWEMKMNQAQIIQATVTAGQRAPAESKDLTFSEYSWRGTWQMYSKPFLRPQNLWLNNRRQLVIQSKNKYIWQE